mgnify:CR=1 FL=1
MEKIKSEIEWIAKNKIRYCYCADANFGILDRDTEIAQYVVDKKSTAVDYQIVKVEDGIAYVALEYVKDHTAMDFEYMAEPNRVRITC